MRTPLYLSCNNFYRLRPAGRSLMIGPNDVKYNKGLMPYNNSLYFKFKQTLQWQWWDFICHSFDQVIPFDPPLDSYSTRENHAIIITPIAQNKVNAEILGIHEAKWLIWSAALLSFDIMNLKCENKISHHIKKFYNHTYGPKVKRRGSI